MDDLPEIIQHLSHAQIVQGGGLLFGDGRGTALLTPEQTRDPRKAWARPLRSGLESTTSTVNGRTLQRSFASSAESVRAMKAKHGIPSRPAPGRS